ncbi:hypothetical protein CTI14_70400, partial [Methylobacterium radiotolerans]
ACYIPLAHVQAAKVQADATDLFGRGAPRRPTWSRWRSPPGRACYIPLAHVQAAKVQADATDLFGRGAPRRPTWS